MKQLIQSFKTGETLLEDIPVPPVSKGNILIKTSHSLVSAGTERMLVEFGKSSLIQKARQQPDKVKQVLAKIKSEGLLPTLEAIFNKLEQPLPLGYCNVGKVVAVGDGITEFNVGDRVASNGNHAEYVSVPQNLAAAIPENVSDEEAAFTVIGSIGLQGIRLCNPTFGETIVVTGLGLIGLITAELLVANGCRVIGIDVDENKIALAEQKGITCINPKQNADVVKFVKEKTNEIGADAVIITASAKGNDIIAQAAQMSRKRGRIILIGVIGLNLSRADFYEKELSFQVSCSYGPGRYDDTYEKHGKDYPLPYVRWTEKRNFAAILQAMSSGKLDVRSLITERIPLHEYKKIYDNLGSKKSVASLLIYPETSEKSSVVNVSSASFKKEKNGIGIIGAGNFTAMTMLPVLKKMNANLVSIASAGGVTGTTLAKKYSIAKSTTDYREVINDDHVNLVLITTRHNLHASMVVETLKHAKHVFVEKPLALTPEELNSIIDAYDGTTTLTVGFNRRFSPHTQKIKQLASGDQMNIIATMNAGFIPANSWVQDLNLGGGRIIGEACHYIDLISFITASEVSEVCMNSMGTHPEENTDNASILLKYKNGSTGVINYFSNGSKAYSKERLEIYCQEKTIILDNFKTTTGYGFKNFSNLKTKMDKGHAMQFKLLKERLENGGPSLIPFNELINTTKAGFAAIESLKNKSWIKID
ncbi:MAG TPA: bi-domain-containing oxidoreductase [Parafilimonas sp.]|nr:bi-domain-containing oxidoreductase [Parafilimonas sp.]